MHIVLLGASQNYFMAHVFSSRCRHLVAIYLDDTSPSIHY